jgi:hypothetical protein
MNIRANNIVAQILLHVSLSQYQYQYLPLCRHRDLPPHPSSSEYSSNLGGSCTKSLIVAYIIVDALVLVDGRRRRRDNRRYFEHHPAAPTRLECTPPPRSIVLSSHEVSGMSHILE